MLISSFDKTIHTCKIVRIGLVDIEQNRTEHNFYSAKLPRPHAGGIREKVIHIHNSMVTLQNRPHCLLRGRREREREERERCSECPSHD